MVFAYLIPLTSGFLVACGNLALKRALQGGFGVTRVVFLISWGYLLGLLPIMFFEHEVLDWSRWWIAVLSGCTTFFGYVFILASLRTGDVSVQTPLQGTKVIFVATYSLFLIPGEIPLSWWAGVILTFLSILLIGSKDLFTKRHSVLSIAYTIISSACFAMTDVLVAKEAPLFGRWPFIYGNVISFAFLSLFLIPFFRGRIFSAPPLGKKWGFWAAGLLAAQNFGLLFALSIYGMPTVINIVYSSRGIWAIVLAWFVGHWFGNMERAAGKGAFVRRTIGAILLMIAIVLVLVE